MITVVETRSFLGFVKREKLSEAQVASVVTTLAENPTVGDLIKGTGGIRKFRVARDGGGKSGGYRVIYYYYNQSHPIFLIEGFGKNEKDNLSAFEKAAMKKVVNRIVVSFKKQDQKR